MLRTVPEVGRHRAAQLLRCQDEEVAFVGPTSLALSYVAAGLNFRKGDNILIYYDDYPSNVYPWMAMASCEIIASVRSIRSVYVAYA